MFYRSLVVLLSMSLVYGSARANDLWGSLSEQEQAMVKERTVTELGKLLKEGEASEELAFVASNIGTWATYTGQIVGGEYADASSAFISYAQDTLYSSFEQELGSRVDSMGSPSLTYFYTQVVKHESAVKDIARHAFNNELEKAGNVAWETAKNEVVTQVNERADLAFDFAYNWVFNGARIAGMAPSDIFREVIRVEKILIKEGSNYLRNSQQYQIMELYRGYLVEANGSHEEAWESMWAHGIPAKGWSVSRLEEGTLKSALKLCADKPYSLQMCIEEVQNGARRKIEKQKEDAERVLKEIADKKNARIKAAYAEMQALIMQQISAVSQEYKDAVSAANSILSKLKAQASGIPADCAAYKEKMALISATRAKVEAANEAAAKVHRYITLTQQCEVLAESPDDLDTLLQQVKQEKTGFDQHLGAVADQADLVCQDTTAIASAYSRADGKRLLQQAVTKHLALESKIKIMQASAQRIRDVNTDIKGAVSALTEEVAALSTSLENYGDVDGLLSDIDAAKGARVGYDATLDELKVIVNRLIARKTNMENANPLQLGLGEQIADAWEKNVVGIKGGIDKAGRTRVSKLLLQYKDFPEVRKITQEMEATYSLAACADEAIKASGAASGFEALKWTSPTFKPGLADELHEARAACENVPTKSTLETIAHDSASVAADMEAMELPFIYEKKSGQCLISGEAAYEALSDPYDALGGEVDQLEAECKQAATKADNASRSAASAAQAASSLNPVGGLRDKANAMAAQINSCAELTTIRGRVAQYAADATNARGLAQSAADHGSGIASTCASKTALGSIDGDLRDIRAYQRDAVVALGKAQEGEEQFDRVVERAKETVSALQEIGTELSRLMLYRSVVKDHIRSATKGREAALEGFAGCSTRQTALAAKAGSLRGSMEDDLLNELLQRIQAVTTQPGSHLDDMVLHLDDAKASVDQWDDANAEVTVLVARASNECLGKETPYTHVLTAMDAIVSIDQLTSSLTRLRDKCVASLDSAGSGGRDDYAGYDQDPGIVDPRRSGGGGGSVVPGGGDTQPTNNPDQQNTTQGGAPIDDTYRGNPIADRERERERIAAAAAAAAAAAEAERRRPDVEPRREDPDGFVQTPDLDDLPDRGDEGRRERPPRAPAATRPDPARPEPSLPEPKTPEPAKPEPSPAVPETTAPVRPEQPVPAPAPAASNPRCEQIARSLQATSNSIMANYNRFMSAAAAKDEETARLVGCRLLVDFDKVLGTFEQLSRENCPIKGNTEELRATMQRMRGEIQRELRDGCGAAPAASPAPAPVPDPAPVYTQFAGRWNSKGKCRDAPDAPFRWVVNLTQNGNSVSGSIGFHKCPGGGRASFNVSGTAGTGPKVTLKGSLFSSRGPLADVVRRNPSPTFTLQKGGAPSPNYAP
ncbi:hypothetical protein C0039_18600 [Pseudohalioglobus lutimaris]|uniref:Uncharacterized protein n=2 Tax=Pseudohalioglobus lutimaris TaxID=1737061 RepID=A0A2N5WY19_9GAMM|nr:hypothetical protein C0039_18600 [Pseudohalioglobus lutimaris]